MSRLVSSRRGTHVGSQQQLLRDIWVPHSSLRQHTIRQFITGNFFSRCIIPGSTGVVRNPPERNHNGRGIANWSREMLATRPSISIPRRNFYFLESERGIERVSQQGKRANGYKFPRSFSIVFFFSLDINLLVNLRQRVEEASRIAAPKIILDSSAAVADK